MLWKKGVLWGHKLLPMDKAIKIIGLTHPGSNNDGIQQKQQ